MVAVPDADVPFSIPKLTSMVDRALPAIFWISLCRNALRAFEALMPEVRLSVTYMPVASSATAVLLRSSALIDISSFCTLRSSGASMVKASPISWRVREISTPTLKFTLRCTSFSVTTARVFSVARMERRGLSISPVNSA